MDNKEYNWQDQLSAVVNANDLEGLIAFSKQVPENDVDAWRKEVMENGFMEFYSYVSYDQMCGKLGDWGLDFLDEIIDAAEEFQGEPLRRIRAEILSYRVDEVKVTDAEQAKTFALRAIDELSYEIDGNSSSLLFRAHLYHELAQLDKDKSLHYWKLAVADINASSDFNLRILYHDWDQSSPEIKEVQKDVITQFIQRIDQQLSINPDLIWKLLDEGVRIQEYKPQADLDEQISLWLKTALSWNGKDAPPMLLRNAGLLLHKQGKKHQEAAYFAKAIECFELFIQKDRAHAMEVNYMANVFEDWAELIERQGENGTAYLMKAWNTYQTHEEVVRINFSPLLHYAEFLLRLYFSDKVKEQPTEQEILSLAVEAEVMGNGYYSGPGMIQVLMAISKNDMPTAVYHLCRLLLRHELCIDNQIKNLRQSLTDKTPKSVAEFLDEALKFMDEVSKGYFYDPKFTMEELNKLSREATLDAWEERMKEIRNRPARPDMQN